MATPAALVAPQAGAAAAGTSGQLSEKEQKERALQERLDKRGTLIAGCMRKFLTNYWAARQQMLDAARAAELAKLAKKGKKGKKSKTKEAKPAKDAKGDKKKVVKTPVQEAWAAFLADLDERINKQKRCSLEDMYRGVAKLAPQEQRALACIVVASNNKKVLPTEGQNANSLNIRQAVFAAAAAFDVPVDKATLSSSAGLALVSQRGASEQQLKEFGFKEADLLRAGCSRPDVIALSINSPDHLKAAGISAVELLATDASGGLSGSPQEPQPRLASQQGAALLRQAGYSAPELMEADVHSMWDLKQGGYTEQEMEEAGVSSQELRAAGFGSRGPPQFLASSYRHLCHYDAQAFPPPTQGTRSGIWASLMPGAAAPKGPGRGVAVPLGGLRQSTQASLSSTGVLPESIQRGSTAGVVAEVS